jgi:hypothetical protein
MKPQDILNALNDLCSFIRRTTYYFVTFVGTAVIVLFEAYLLSNAPFLKDSSSTNRKEPHSSIGNQTPKTEAPNNDTTNEAFRAEVMTGSIPNSYAVRLTWVGSKDAMGWLIRRWDMKTEPITIATLKKDAREFVDQKIVANHLYRYALRALPRSKGYAIQEAMVVIPKDVVLKGENHLKSISKVNRLFFAPGSKIITDGSPFSIDAKEIYSEGGIIETFPENQTAAPGSDGRIAEAISVSASGGAGRLYIYSRGENGGRGISGKPGLQGAAGEDGHDAEIEISDLVLGALNDAAPFSRQAPHFQADAKDLLHCKSPADDGTIGSPGTSGGVGGNGGKGGDAAQVFVNITDHSKLQVDTFYIPGHGGAGGVGGPGGPGGVGGNPGSQDPLELCASARRGERGPQGPKGKTGEPGEDGNEPPPFISPRLSLAE